MYLAAVSEGSLRAVSVERRAEREWTGTQNHSPQPLTPQLLHTPAPVHTATQPAEEMKEEKSSLGKLYELERMSSFLYCY